jgi:L-malate glycosyltransferase
LPLRILQISSAQFLGGGERYLADLSRGLVSRGHEVYAALRAHSPLVQQLSQLPKENMTALPLRNSLDAHSARKLSAFVKQHEIEIVHAHLARDYPLAAYAAARNRNARLIITRHVLFPLNRLHKLTLSHVARGIAVSEAVALQLRAERIIPSERIAVVPNGIDVDRFERAITEFNRSRFLQLWNLPAEGLLVGTLGELKVLKGQEEFLHAAALVARLLPNAHFIIAGIDSSRGQQNRQSLERLTDELGLRDRVRFLDWLDDVAVLHCALDVFVSASRSESFGLAIAEAMASRTAVVATMTEGAREIIDEGRTGLLVPIGDAKSIAESVVSLLKDQAKREQLASAAAETVRIRFGLNRMIDATEAIYREALGNE